MTGSDAAAWAQAYLSAAAILVSGLLAVGVPWNERRIARKRELQARLSVDCSRSDTGGLRLEVSFTPEFHSHAVGAMVRVIEPADACVYQGEPVPSGGDPSDRVVPNGLNKRSRYNAVSLHQRRSGSAAGTISRSHHGVLFVEYPDEREGPTSAKIEVSILRHGNHLLMTRTLRVSQSDASYYANGAPIAIIASGDD